MNSNYWHFFCSTLTALVLILLGFIWHAPASVGADLPSCIRAKCSHCRVPFIAEMCPGACAVCGPIGNKLFITTAQQSAQVPDARAFGQSQLKVPFAQQLPFPSSVGGAQQQRVGEAVPAAQQRQHQRQVNSRGVNNNNNNNGRQKPLRNQYGTDFGAGAAEQKHYHHHQQQQQQLPFQNGQQGGGGQFVPADHQNQGGQFVPAGGQFGPLPYQNQQQQQGGQFVAQSGQFGQFVPPGDQGGQQFVPQNQQGGSQQFMPADQRQGGQFSAPQQQQTTSFGGFYNQQQQPDEFFPQAGFGPVPPPPPPLPPPIQSADGGGVGGGGTFANPFQPFLQQSFNSQAQQFQPQQAQNGFTFAPPINGGGGDGGGNGGITPVPSPTAAQFGTPIQPQQPQQYFGQYSLQPQQQQQQNNNNNNNFNGQFNGNGNNNNNNNQHETFEPPTPVLHAVPNIADPLQRPRQIYPGVQQGPSDKNLQNLVEPGNNNFLLNKGAIGDELKKPFIPNGFIQGENGQTCPKQPNWEPCVPKEIANQRFRNCCARLGDGCQQLCSYDQNLGTIQLAVLTGRCPVSRVGEMMVCASGNEDATACCQAFGVFESGFDHCRPYCNPSGGLPNDGMLAEKYRCLQKLTQIQKCFYLTQRP
ncbi:hypothetical protein niasHT_025980 [Heterodera trifolii]|uniref:Domain of unknown function DB domain-containing protein n=1 Tax=Heterodera trifolii TaxID=157864 RepID=A0ABD2JAL2_9BILA